MRDTLLKIAEYLEEGNSRLQMLEQKVEAAEKANEELTKMNKELADKVALLESRIEELENRSVVTEEDEPKVELIVADDEQPEELPTITEPEPVIEPEPNAEIPVQEQVAAETVTARTEEPKMKVPVQTSLFGTAVTDIRHGMAIGDRFLFQRELFGGNGEAMQKAFNDINECEDMADAIAYIDNLGWNKESTSYELFINYLRRRFDH